MQYLTYLSFHKLKRLRGTESVWAKYFAACKVVLYWILDLVLDTFSVIILASWIPLSNAMAESTDKQWNEEGKDLWCHGKYYNLRTANKRITSIAKEQKCLIG